MERWVDGAMRALAIAADGVTKRRTRRGSRASLHHELARWPALPHCPGNPEQQYERNGQAARSATGKGR